MPVFNVKITTPDEVRDRCIDPTDNNFTVLYLDPGERLPDLTPYAGREILLVFRQSPTRYAC